VLGLVLILLVISEFGGFAQLLVEVLRETNAEADHRHSGLVRRFDLLDASVNLSSRRRAAAEETHHNTGKSDQRNVNCAAVAKAVGMALHSF
jgi:hypothetical protein